MHEILRKIAHNNPQMSWIQNSTHLLVRHGSMAYGTNIESSDQDYKGITIPPKQYFFGTTHRFEQAELHEPDAVIFEMRKFFKLAAECNPNCIEILFVDPSDYILIDQIGEILLEHRNDFLSKKARQTFLGYARQQLKRLKLHKAYFENEITHNPTRAEYGLPEHTLIPTDQLLAAEAEIKKELSRFQFDFMESLDEPTKIGIQNTMTEMLAELKITSEQHWASAARKIGLSDNFIQLMQLERQYTGAKKEYDQYQNWKKNRNPKRAADEEKYGIDLKHSMHLIRLTRMAKEILTTGKVIVKRPDREELIAIRNGTYTYEQIVEQADKIEQEIKQIYETCTILPAEPDYEKLDQLCIQLVEKSLSQSSVNLKTMQNITDNIRSDNDEILHQ